MKKIVYTVFSLMIITTVIKISSIFIQEKNQNNIIYDEQSQNNETKFIQLSTGDIHNNFTDIDNKSWYAESVIYCKENGILSGITETEFAPDISLNRAMLTTILWRLDGSKIVNGNITFDDVPTNTWYTEAIRWVNKSGIMSGYNEKTFGVTNYVTREQISSILYRFESYKNKKPVITNNIEYSDNDKISDWAYESVLWVTENKITPEKSNNIFAPQDEITRAELAFMIHSYLTLDLNNNLFNESTNSETNVNISNTNQTSDRNIISGDIKDDNMISVSLEIGSKIFTAKFYNNEATQKLLTQMPLSINMSDLNRNEKYYKLSENLPSSLSERPSTINAGDIMCWSGDTLVVFYETFSNSYGGYVSLGYVEDVTGFAAALGSGSANVRFTVN